MRKFENYWMSNKEWYFFDEYGNAVLKDGAPPEARESYSIYLEQCERAEKDRKENGYLD